jgi:Uma2 family endonuclease
MTVTAVVPPRTEVVYPDSDGKPMAENTKQLRWIVVIYGGLCSVFRERDDVFVAADLLWYPEEGRPEVNTAPDVYVAFGRPKGHRGSYKQWEEGGIAPQVVFEILSPGNDVWEMSDKLAFYDEHGVEEYYLYDPDKNRLDVYLRQGTVLRRRRNVREWTSPRLNIRFDLRGEEMVVHEPGPDGQRFRSYEEVRAELDAEKALRLDAERRATDAERRATDAEQHVNRLAQRLRDAGINPDS